MAYRLTDYSFPEFNEMVKDVPTVILPVGLIEQHGYHLPLGTDIYNANVPIELGFDRLNAFIAPTLNYCFSGGGFKGTMNVNPLNFGLFVTEICKEFVGMGFKNIVVFMGHLGSENIDALKLSLQVFLRDEANKDIAVIVTGLDYMSKTYEKLATPDPVDGGDFHAGHVETSLMMYWKPELVHMEKLQMDEPEAAHMLRTDQDWYAQRTKAFDNPQCCDRVIQRPELKVGVMGFPERATAELGKKVTDESLDYFEKLINDLNARVK